MTERQAGDTPAIVIGWVPYINFPQEVQSRKLADLVRLRAGLYHEMVCHIVAQRGRAENLSLAHGWLTYTVLACHHYLAARGGSWLDHISEQEFKLLLETPVDPDPGQQTVGSLLGSDGDNVEGWKKARQCHLRFSSSYRPMYLSCCSSATSIPNRFSMLTESSTLPPGARLPASAACQTAFRPVAGRVAAKSIR